MDRGERERGFIRLYFTTLYTFRGCGRGGRRGGVERGKGVRG